MARSILVIGGASGIGKATVERLKANGDDVTFTTREQFDATSSNSTLSLSDQIDGLVYCPGTINLKPFHRMTDEDFMKLNPVATSIRHLVINATSVSEDAMVATLPKMVNLKKLNLSETAITDNGIHAITQLQELEYLNLFGTEVTDAGIAKLKTLTQLRKLYLWDSKATQAGVDALQKELPSLEINFPKP